MTQKECYLLGMGVLIGGVNWHVVIDHGSSGQDLGFVPVVALPIHTDKLGVVYRG